MDSEQITVNGRKILVVGDDPSTENIAAITHLDKRGFEIKPNPPVPFPNCRGHRYPLGATIKSKSGAEYRVDQITGAFKRLNPALSKKAAKKAAQRMRRAK